MTSRYAETWTDVGRLPLRRRDRASLVLALEAIRGGFHNSAIANVLKTGGPAALSVWAALEDSASWTLAPRRECDFRCRQSLLRARLALLLRTLLRVDAGDYGKREHWLQCDRCFRVERDLESAAAAQGVCVPYPRDGAEDCAPGSHAPGLLSPMRWPLPPHRCVSPLWQAARRAGQ